MKSNDSQNESKLIFNYLTKELNIKNLGFPNILYSKSRQIGVDSYPKN